MTVPTGVSRLDELLGGGVPKGGVALAYGPPFTGKTLLGYLFGLRGLQEGAPTIFVTTDVSAFHLRERLAELDPRCEEYEGEGLVHFVDTYSKSVGAADDFQYAEYVENPTDANGLALAVNNAQRRFIGEHGTHRLVIDSVSTLMTYTNAQAAFRFLQVLLGKAKMAGATTLLCLEEGMHDEGGVQMIKHLTDGVIEMRRSEGEPRLRIEGFDLGEDHGWVEYRFDREGIELTGSTSAGSIR